jgi:hypothetical protein
MNRVLITTNVVRCFLNLYWMGFIILCGFFRIVLGVDLVSSPVYIDVKALPHSNAIPNPKVLTMPFSIKANSH